METSHIRHREIELDPDRFVEDSFVYSTQVIEPDNSVNVMLLRNMPERIAKLFVLLGCEGANRAGAVPQRAIQIKENRFRQ